MKVIGLYPDKTLYAMCVFIQNYLQINKIKWKHAEGDEFRESFTELDNVMYQRVDLKFVW